MQATFKALGALLTYPTEALIAALPEIEGAVLADRRLSRSTKAGVRTLVHEIARGDLIDLQERYVDLFDRGRHTALHLFEHVHGDSRERGPAMVDLKRIYADAGFAMAMHELPDYLPAVLEFASLAPDKAGEILSDCAHIVRRIGEALAARHSSYAAVPAAVLDAIGEEGLSEHAPARAEPSLDEQWKEEPVFFGPAGGQGCGASTPQVSVVQFVSHKA